MEIITIKVDYPGGLTLTDGATWIEGAGQILVSERLKQLLRELDVSEARPVVTATCRGQKVALTASADWDFRLSPGEIVLPVAEGFLDQLKQVLRRPSREQRQQFGRFCHTLSAGATIGAVGFWHSTNLWDWQNFLSVWNLCLIAVVLFYIGIISMDGE
ncbi:hypothetical protein [Paraburkholderia tropica]|uniref:hypothetical protein n=1 Tax=Paraburkholderia tropica TaxID=92647 RepID=UPI0007ECE181|nr:MULTISPECIES: hypothetical protein [Paraburkholderia]OBR54011.1 hypothetical protein A6456_22035 [Paraburkholderia tropica]RQM45191.1 hypothetical protein EHZ19_24790 [Paraburkholderia bannensis]